MALKLLRLIALSTCGLKTCHCAGTRPLTDVLVRHIHLADGKISRKCQTRLSLTSRLDGLVSLLANSS